MRKVVAFAFLSLDGVAESPDRFFNAWDDVVDRAGEELIATQDAVILGRGQLSPSGYLLADYAPTLEDQPC